MIIHIVAGTLVVILNFVFSFMADGDKPSGVTDSLGHSFFGVILYFLAVASLITGFLVIGIWTIYMFLPKVTKLTFLIPKFFRLLHIVSALNFR